MAIFHIQGPCPPGESPIFVQGVYTNFGDADGLVQIPRVYFEFDGKQKAKAMTKPVLDHTISNFENQNGSLPRGAHSFLEAKRSGTINALRLTSITETIPGVTFGSTDDTMPATIIPLPKEISVKSRDNILIKLFYRYGEGWDNFHVHL